MNPIRLWIGIMMKVQSNDENGRYSIKNGNENVNYWFRCQTIRWREVPLANPCDVPIKQQIQSNGWNT